jgi:hypothetical protein
LVYRLILMLFCTRYGSQNSYFSKNVTNLLLSDFPNRGYRDHSSYPPCLQHLSPGYIEDEKTSKKVQCYSPYSGFPTFPMNRRAPVEFSLITYRKGLSTKNVRGPEEMVDSSISTMVAAAASVPSS